MKNKIITAILCGVLACTPVYANPNQGNQNEIQMPNDQNGDMQMGQNDMPMPDRNDVQTPPNGSSMSGQDNVPQMPNGEKPDFNPSQGTMPEQNNIPPMPSNGKPMSGQNDTPPMPSNENGMSNSKNDVPGAGPNADGRQMNPNSFIDFDDNRPNQNNAQNENVPKKDKDQKTRPNDSMSQNAPNGMNGQTSDGQKGHGKHGKKNRQNQNKENQNENPSEMNPKAENQQENQAEKNPNTENQNENMNGRGGKKSKMPPKSKGQVSDSNLNEKQSEDQTDGSVDSNAQKQPPADGTQMPEKPDDGFDPSQIPDGHDFDPAQGPMHGQTENVEYTAVSTLEEDSKDETFESSASDESAVLVDGKTVTVSGASVNKTGDSDAGECDFNGTNAGMLAINGGTMTITDSEITTDGKHANGIFSTGNGTTVNVSDTEITTTGDNSGGIMTTGGAVMNAENLIVNTSGRSSAAIRSDRGGGTVTVSKGEYNTTGVGSPAIYSTADISVSDATLTASDSEGVVIEGGNSVKLDNVNLTGNDATLNGQSTVKTNVLIYQSMSGDASEGNSSFVMNGGSMTSETGCMFHITNTTTTIDLSNVEMTNASDSDEFITLSADAWGREGSNGGHATLNLDSQEVTGNATVDSLSDLVVSLKNNSSYTGAINSANEGKVTVTIEDGSTWTLTGDSYVDSIDGIENVNTNGYKLYVAGAEV